MTRLTNTQLVILSAASQRDDGAVLPLPETLRIKGGAVDKVLKSLKGKGLIDPQGAPRGDDPPPLCVTRAGLEAIGVEPAGEETQVGAPAATEADAPATAADAGVQAVEAPAPTAKADSAPTPATSKATAKAAKVKAAKRGKAAPADLVPLSGASLHRRRSYDRLRRGRQKVPQGFLRRAWSIGRRGPGIPEGRREG